MTNRNSSGPSVRVVEYDGSLAQCEDIGSITIDAFGAESPETFAVRARLRQASQRTWLAQVEDDAGAAGFLATFPTWPLSGPRVEFDLLAVRTARQGQGLAGQLMAAARKGWSGSSIGRARALIRQGNAASERVFERAGFEPADAWSEVLIGQATGETDGLAGDGITVRPAEAADFAELARRWPAHFEGRPADCRLPRDDWGLLVARHTAGLVGFVELLAVHTILYSGVWLERLDAAGDDGQVLGALAGAARAWAAGRDLELAGAVIDLAHEPARDALRRVGYQPAGIYRYFHLPAGADRW